MEITYGKWPGEYQSFLYSFAEIAIAVILDTMAFSSMCRNPTFSILLRYSPELDESELFCGVRGL